MYRNIDIAVNRRQCEQVIDPTGATSSEWIAPAVQEEIRLRTRDRRGNLDQVQSDTESAKELRDLASGRRSRTARCADFSLPVRPAPVA